MFWQRRLFNLCVALALLLTFSPKPTLAAPPVDSSPAWLDPAWGFRRVVTITNTSGAALTDYQVRIALDNSFDFTKARPDGSDLRVTSSDGVTLLPYWIESWDSVGHTANIWVKASSIPTAGTTVYLYYGNASANTAANGSNTFDLFEDNWSQFTTAPTGVNPVQSADQSWWEATTSYPMVFEDTSFAGRPRYHMLFDGHQGPIGNAKGYAWSADLKNWTSYDAGAPHATDINPILGAGYTGNAAFAWGDTIKVGSTYYMYTSRGPGETVRAESTDLIHWSNIVTLNTTDPGKIGTGVAILKQGDGITPILVDGKYWMVYFHGDAVGSMYLASADPSDLLTWTPWAGNPLLVPTPGAWDSGGMWTPSFVLLAGKYYIYYEGTADGQTYNTGFASAAAFNNGNPIRPDVASWTKSGTNSDGVPDPVLTHGASGAWDDMYAIDPAVRQFSDGVYYLFYTGYNTHNYSANGYATATSPDGPWTKLAPLGWTKYGTGTPTVSNGILTLGILTGVGTNATYTYQAVGFRANFASGRQTDWGGFINGSAGYRVMIRTLSTDDTLYLRNNNSNGTDESKPLSGSWRNAFHVYEVLWSAGQSTAIIDHGASTASSTTQVPTSALPVTFFNYSDPTYPLRVDWVYVRQYRSPEPTLAVGAEEQRSSGPPLFPDHFFGEIHVLDNPPQVGDSVQAHIAGVTTPVAATIDQQAGILHYQMDVLSDNTDTPEKDGGAEGDALTFTVNGRVVATGTWHTGGTTQLDFHPPQALVTNSGPVNESSSATIDASTATDFGNDRATYAFDCGNDGTFEIGPQAGATAQCAFADNGSSTVQVRVLDAQGGVGLGSTVVTVNNVAPTAQFAATSPVNEGGSSTLSFTGAADPSPADMAAGLHYSFACDGQDSSLATTYAGAGASASTTCPFNTGGNHTVKGRVFDKDNGATTYPATVSVVGHATLALVPGWNLVSFNVHPVDTSIAAILASLGSNYDLVYAWDATGAHPESGNWLKYDPNQPYLNSLATLDETRGFWIHLTANATLNVTGSVPQTTDIQLVTNAGGWNLVGYPSTTTNNLPAAVSDHGVNGNLTLVYAYDATDAANPWRLFDPAAQDGANDLTALQPGWGYWIQVNTNATWHVDNP